MKWNTAISTDTDGEHIIRGQKLSNLMQNHTFTEVVFLLMVKRFPTEGERKLFNMLLISSAEHGVAAPSVFSARVAASVGNTVNAALAAGLLASGQWHGGAVEACAKLLESEVTAEHVVAQVLEGTLRLPGFGHKTYKDVDPRAEMLLDTAIAGNISGQHTKKALEIRDLLKTAGKPLLINIDGAMAALLCDMGFSSKIVNGVFLLGRVSGILAHIDEELTNEKPYRRLDAEDITYTG